MLEQYWGVDPKDKAHWNTTISHRAQFEYFGLTKLSNQLIFFYDGHLRLHQGPEYAVELITNAARQTGRLPVLCLDGNPCDANRYHQELSQHLDTNDFFIFHPDIRPHLSDQPNLAPWPSWWFFQLMEHNHQLNRPKKHRVSFLSGSSRYHRVKLLHDIKPYITDQDVIIVNQIGNIFKDMLPQGWWDELPWTNTPEFFDYVGTSGYPPKMEQNNHPAFAAHVNINGETSHTDQVLLSEKTWKAYRSGCLVVNYGPEQATQTLKDLGFEIWDEFDQVGTHEHKASLIVKLMQRDDIADLYQKNLDMIRHNVAWFKNPMAIKKVTEMAVLKLENLLSP
jgi:hypothetical protein